MNYKIPFKLLFFFFVGCNITLYAQTDVIWTNPSSKTVITGNSIQKLNGGNGGWNHGAIGSTTMASNEDGYIQVTIEQTNLRRSFGLSVTPNTGHTRDEIDYCIQLHNNGTIIIYEEGSNKGTFGGYSVGDIIKIERTGSTISYQKNGQELKSTENASTSELIFDSSIRDNTGKISNAQYSFGGGGCNTTVYADTDNDGFGDPNSSIVDCTNPVGYVANNTDCDDTDGDINPNTVWYQDSDNDGFGNSAVSQTQCTQPNGYVLDNTDCDDTTNDPNNDCGGGGSGPSVWTQLGDDIRYSDGKVFIGNEALDISSNDYNLFVEKGIMTERLKVAIEGSGDWADYVFKNGYNMMTLEEVQNFINKNGHLPNVPSADQVANEGIDVSKMFPILLRQIEENKLYLIQMNEEVKHLKEENAKLKQKNIKK